MSREYDLYLAKHRENVQRALDWLKEHEIVDQEYEFLDGVHDKSKDSPTEYEAYDLYFNGGDSREIEENFNYAWLEHIHHNPHHWQYWVLLGDDDGIQPLDIPDCYIIEMICDWWSFGWGSGNLYEIFDWYNQHKHKMILSEQTKEKIEDILKLIRMALKS